MVGRGQPVPAERSTAEDPGLEEKPLRGVQELRDCQCGQTLVSKGHAQSGPGRVWQGTDVIQLAF